MEESPTIAIQGQGRIITFYSYKGGVGRTMALANIAVLLARMEKKVLVIDWDLEAPGLKSYFTAANLSPPGRAGGLLCMLESACSSSEQFSYRDFVHSTHHRDFRPIDVLGSGDEELDYGQRVGGFSWSDFFFKKRGAQWLENLRAEWKQDYDFVLIDSRTGITDSGGVCTIQLPDTLVFVVGPNQQNLEGCRRVVSSIHRQRTELPFDRARLLILPVISRFDGREESALAKEWLGKCVHEFRAIFDDWLPKDCAPLDVLERTKLPHVARYSFGEELAVLAERESDPDQLAYYYSAIARILVSDFRDILDILGKQKDRSALAPPVDPVEAAKNTYDIALDLARKNDVLGWRKLTQKTSATIPSALVEWQNLRRTNLPDKVDGLPQMLLEAASFSSPRIAIALAGVESQNPQFSNQLGYLDELQSPVGWERSGNTILVEIPQAMAFVYQALLGGIALQTQQGQIAHRLANTTIQNIYSSKAEPLFRASYIIGWPRSLNQNCIVAWNFLMQLPDNWPWLLDAFGDKDSYQSSVAAYYMFLNVVEFCDAVERKLDLVNSNGISFNVPIGFATLTDTNQKSAARYLKDVIPFLVAQWKHTGLSHDQMSEKWKDWLRLINHWVANVYRNGFLWGLDRIPINDIPDWIAKA